MLLRCLLLLSLIGVSFAADFTYQRELVDDEAFRKRCIQAAVTAAIAVMAEPVETDGHSARVALAIQIIRSPDAWAYPVAVAAATNPALVKENTDADLQFTVNSHFNALAGHSSAVEVKP